MAEKIELEQIENGPSLIQTLSVGTGMGQLNITNGNTVHLGSISLSNKQDANTHPKNSGGLEAFSYNAPSAVNYPNVPGSGGGGGISFYRNNSAGGLLSSFDIVKAEHSEEKLRFRVGISTTAKGGWKTFASEEYVNDAIAGLGLDDIKIGGRNFLLQSNVIPVRLYHVTYSYSRVVDNSAPSGSYFRFDNLAVSGVSPSIYFTAGNNADYSENISGRQMVVSLYIKGSANFVFANKNIGTSWTKVKFAHTWHSSGNQHLYFSSITSPITIDIAAIKVEYGVNPTDWTPAPEDQVSDWNETDNTKYSFIKNKPTIPTSNDFITTNTTQTGLTGNKTTSGGSWNWNNGEHRMFLSGAVGSSTLTFDTGHYNNSDRFHWVAKTGSASGIITVASLDHYGYLTAVRFKKAGQNDTQMLLAGGGHRPVSDFALISQVYTQAQALALFVGKTGVETIQDTKTFTHSPLVPNGTLNGHTVNLGQLNSLLANYALSSAVPTNNNQLTNGAGYITVAALGGYVQQSALNTQLANYVTLGSVQTITATKTYTVSPVVPNGTLAGHTVNLGQMQSYVTGLGYTTLAAVQTWVNSQGYLTSVALNGYVLQSSLNTQLANYATLAGTQTFTGTNTFTQSPVVPAGSLSSHTVNLGQMQSYVTGLGYQTASQVTAIVNNAVSAIPAPGNGSVVIQGINALTGTATFSMNQSNNVVGSFDLTTATKNDITAGVNAGNQLNNLFGDCQNYFAHHDVSAGGTVDTNKAFYNLLDPHGAQPTVVVSNHHVHGARLILHSYAGVGFVTYKGEFMKEGVHHNTVYPENGKKWEFTWNEDSQVWIYVLPD